MEATNAKGWYLFDVAQAEANADVCLFTGKSVTANVSVVGMRIDTTPASFTSGVAQTGDNYARLGAPAGASVSADIAAAKVDTAAIKVKTDFLPSATAGAAGGVFIAGTNAATAITTGLTAHLIGTVDTVTTYTGNTPQTGDTYARIGAAGAGLTALGDTRIANLDAAVSTRASPTNITAGTITTVTNLTNAATAGDLTATMKTSIGTAVAASAVASVTGNVGGNVTGTVGSVVGAVGSVTGAVGSVTGAVGSVTGLTAANLDVAVSTRMATYSQPTGFLAATFPGGTIANTTNITAATVTTDVTSIGGSAEAATNLKRGCLGTGICTVGTGSTISSIVTSSMDPAAAATDQFKGRIITFDRATTTTNLRGQATDITGSTAGGVLTVTALTTAPVSGDLFVIT